MRLEDVRSEQRQNWLNSYGANHKITPITGDASFRRYFRVLFADGQSKVLMDAPPEQEPCTAFVNIANLFAACQLPAPKIYAQDLEQGFLLLDDLGDKLFLQQPDYPQAMQLLNQLQQISPPPDLPLFNAEFIATECERFKTWFLGEHLQMSFTTTESQQFAALVNLLQANASAQPQVFIHRDYHSRNLMINPQGKLIMIDFQDAMQGPITYDLVSLLRDCYIAWPADQVRAWALQYLKNSHLKIDSQTWLRWFDWQGVQRHIKVCGIFARLYHRDGKANYLNDLPRVLNYLTTVSAQYSELNFLNQFLQRLPCAP